MIEKNEIDDVIPPLMLVSSDLDVSASPWYIVSAVDVIV